ncbi:MAG: hypothetical protein A3F43_00080 [Gammaproteobacteria bacterium RIFCSPHIGHO2_12_FULL_42_10]|nr:MAG: hypothetical protein A3F43_00080 [Gammaproteobacteria bacterium RIFCSPHIGHO2_12_FULL_42_10]
MSDSRHDSPVHLVPVMNRDTAENELKKRGATQEGIWLLRESENGGYAVSYMYLNKEGQPKFIHIRDPGKNIVAVVDKTVEEQLIKMGKGGWVLSLSAEHGCLEVHYYDGTEIKKELYAGDMRNHVELLHSLHYLRHDRATTSFMVKREIDGKEKIVIVDLDLDRQLRVVPALPVVTPRNTTNTTTTSAILDAMLGGMLKADVTSKMYTPTPASSMTPIQTPDVKIICLIDFDGTISGKGGEETVKSMLYKSLCTDFTKGTFISQDQMVEKLRKAFETDPSFAPTADSIAFLRNMLASGAEVHFVSRNHKAYIQAVLLAVDMTAAEVSKLTLNIHDRAVVAEKSQGIPQDDKKGGVVIKVIMPRVLRDQSAESVLVVSCDDDAKGANAMDEAAKRCMDAHNMVNPNTRKTLFSVEYSYAPGQFKWGAINDAVCAQALKMQEAIFVATSTLITQCADIKGYDKIDTDEEKTAKNEKSFLKYQALRALKKAVTQEGFQLNSRNAPDIVQLLNDVIEMSREKQKDSVLHFLGKTQGDVGKAAIKIREQVLARYPEAKVGDENVPPVPTRGPRK